MDRILIRNAIIVSMDPAVGNLKRGSILVEGDRIAAIGHDLTADDARIIDAEGLIALPGFVDAHRHVWQGALSMIAPDAVLGNYFTDILGKLAPVYTAEDAAIGTLCGALQAIDAGVTTIFDWSHIQNSPEHSDGAIAALRESGMRAVFGYGFPNLGPEWFFESRLPLSSDIRRIRKDLLPGDDGRVTMALGLRGPEMSGIEVTSHDLALGRELGLRASVHVGNGDFGRPYAAIEQMAKAGLLGDDIQFVHGNSLDDASIARIADTGGQVAVTPTVELQMQFGMPATTRFLAAGVRAGLGVDVVTSADAGLFTQMAATFQIARQQAYEAGTPSIDVRDALSFATIDAARSIGLDHLVGSLTIGKKADIVLLRPPVLTPLNDPIGWIVLAAGSGSVDTVIIDGVVQKQAGKLSRPVDAYAARLDLSRARLLAASGISECMAAYR